MKEFMGVCCLLSSRLSSSSDLFLTSPSLLTQHQMFSGLVDRCFDACIDDFTTKSLIARESGCVSRCVSKFMAGSERIGQRFAEQQAQMMQQPQR